MLNIYKILCYTHHFLTSEKANNLHIDSVYVLQTAYHKSQSHFVLNKSIIP